MDDLQAAKHQIEQLLVNLSATDGPTHHVRRLRLTASYWASYADHMLCGNERIEYERIAKLERQELASLNQEDWELFPKLHMAKLGIIELGHRIVECMEQWKPSPDGYLGFLRIVKSKFEFLTVTENLAIAEQSPDSIVFASEFCKVSIGIPRVAYSGFNFILGNCGTETPQLEDLLFAVGEQRFPDLIAGLAPVSERELEMWFERAAQAFAMYGRVVLENKPGTLEWLLEAQRLRDRQYVANLDALYGEGQDSAFRS